MIRTTLYDPASLVSELQAAVRAIDPQVPLSDVQTFEEVVSRSLWRQRLQGNVLAIFAAMSLVLACVGLYGVISYAVAQRTRELGVRMALGASRRTVMFMVFGQSGRVVVAGITIGVMAAFFAVRIMAAALRRRSARPRDVLHGPRRAGHDRAAGDDRAGTAGHSRRSDYGASG